MAGTVLYLHEAGNISGAENSLIELVSNIDTSKFRAVAACPAEGGFADRLRSSGAKVYEVDFPPVRYIFGVASVVRALRKVILEERVSIIHSNSIRTHIYAMLASCKKGIPLVWHERNILDRTKDLLDLDRIFSFLPDAIICNSHAVAERFMKDGKPIDKVSVIHNGVDTARFNPSISGSAIRRRFGISPEEVVIGIASRFNKIKGHEALFSACSHLMDKLPGSHLGFRVLAVGSAVFDEDRDRECYLKEYARKLKIYDRIVFTGKLDNMPEAYAAMDIVVLPSLVEACSRVIIEAMAMGRPVVGTSVGGNPEMIVDGVTGILVPPGDEAKLVDALKVLVELPEMRRVFGDAARSRCEGTFSIDQNVRKTEELYSKLLKKAKS